MVTSSRLPRAGRRLAVLVIAVLVALAGLTTTATAAPKKSDGGLPRLNVTDTYVAGVSSGGYMATQLQVAYSSRIAGAAIFSAGPYWCALGTVLVALQSCSDYNAPTPMPLIHEKTEWYERAG